MDFDTGNEDIVSEHDERYCKYSNRSLSIKDDARTFGETDSSEIIETQSSTSSEVSATTLLAKNAASPTIEDVQFMLMSFIHMN